MFAIVFSFSDQNVPEMEPGCLPHLASPLPGHPAVKSVDLRGEGGTSKINKFILPELSGIARVIF
jgi:hypothetical protein